VWGGGGDGGKVFFRHPDLTVSVYALSSMCYCTHSTSLQCLRHSSLSECVYVRGGLMGGKVRERVCMCMGGCYVCV